MIHSLRGFLCLLICALLLPMAALAEDCFVIDVDSLDMNSLNSNDYVADHLSAQTQGIRVRKYISSSNELAAQVRLTVTQAETSTIVFDKNYGYISGTFDSGDIYLPYVDNNVIPYLITLNIEDWTYAMPFMHLQPRLSGNRACTYGVRLKDFNPSITNSWVMGTMLDLDALRGEGTLTVPLCASNLYLIGQATVAISGDWLTVFADFDASANVEVQSSAVYLFGDVGSITTDEASSIPQPAHALGEAIDVSGLSTALLYLPITLSYDSSNLADFSYDLNSADLSQQLALWNQNLESVSQKAQSSAEEAVAALNEPTDPAAEVSDALPGSDAPDTGDAQLPPDSEPTPTAAEPTPTLDVPLPTETKASPVEDVSCSPEATEAPTPVPEAAPIEGQ